MSIADDLPDGITLNFKSTNSISVDYVTESINNTQCPKCGIIYESILLNSNGRHEGIIKMTTSESSLWKNPLPKDRSRAIKVLDEQLIKKLDNHKERHKND